MGRRKGKWVAGVLPENQTIHVFWDNIGEFAIKQPRGLAQARKYALSVRSRGVWKQTAGTGRWGFSTSYTDQEALEAGKITQEWLDSGGIGGAYLQSISEESRIYYPAHLIKIHYEEVERILAGGKATLSPGDRYERDRKIRRLVSLLKGLSQRGNQPKVNAN